MTEQDVYFVLVDYVIFGIALAGSLGIGLFFALSGGKQKTTSEFLLGNRHMRILPVALSLVVSFESSIMIIGYPAEVYVYGIMFWLSVIAFFLVNLVVLRIWIPLIHPLKVTSVNEYLELRYKSRAIRAIGTLFGCFTQIFYMGTVLYAPAISLRAATDFPLWVSIVVIAGASVIYTSIGGLKAVIWTDVFQCVILFMGVFAIIIKGTIEAGGISNVFRIASDTGRLNFLNFDPDPTVRHTFWSLIIGAGITYTHYMFDQSTVQRISAVETETAARKVFYIAAPAFLLTFSLATFEGLIAYAYFYTKKCDPLASGRITNSNQIILYMVLDLFKDYPGMPGLFMASLFSASLSTLSSGLASLTTQTTEDIIKPTFKAFSDFKFTVIAKLLVIVYGVICMGIAFMVIMVKDVPIHQITLSFMASFAGPLSGMMLYSAYCPWANKRGAVIGTFVSVSLILWIALGQNFSKSLGKTPGMIPAPIDQCNAYNVTGTANAYYTEMPALSVYNVTLTSPMAVDADFGPTGIDRLYSMSYQWLGALGVTVMLVVGTVVSFVTGRPDPKSVDVRYVLPVFDYLLPCLPMKVKKFLYFGVRFEKRALLLDKGNSDSETNTSDERENLTRDTYIMKSSTTTKENIV